MPNSLNMVDPWVISWHQTDTSGTPKAIDVTVNANPTAASSATYSAFAARVLTNGAQNFSAGSIGLTMISDGVGTGTAVSINGITSLGRNTSHTTVTTVSGISSNATSALGTITNIISHNVNFGATGGTVTNATGVKINAPTISGVTPTNVYGLWVGAISGGTNNYAIFVTSGSVRLDALTASKVLALDANKNIVSYDLVAADLPTTAVTPGSYINANITVDAQGRITEASTGNTGTASTTFTIAVGGNEAILSTASLTADRTFLFPDVASSTFLTTKNATVDVDVIIGTVGKGLHVKTGANATAGTAVLVGGSVVVSTTKVTADSIILITSQVDGGAPGFIRVSARTPATSFTITSDSGTDTSTIGWLIIEPAA